MSVFDENFESYSPGQDNVGGWLDIGFFKGQVVDFGTNAGGNLFGRTGQGYHMGLGGYIQYINSGTDAAGPSVTVVWAAVNTPDTWIAINEGTSTGTGQQVARFHVESDDTVSLYMFNVWNANGSTNTTLLGNSQTQVVHTNVWQYYQTVWQIEPVPVHSISGTTTSTFTRLQVIGDVWVEGTHLFSGTGTSDVDPTGTYTIVSGTTTTTHTLGSDIDTYAFSGDGYIDDLYGLNAGVGTATFPHPGTAIQARMTQGVAELIKQTPSEVRQSQGVVEIVNQTIGQVRMSQGVIELIKRGGTAGWLVHEA